MADWVDKYGWHTHYFVDAEAGSDENNGFTPATALKTCRSLQALAGPWRMTVHMRGIADGVSVANAKDYVLTPPNGSSLTLDGSGDLWLTGSTVTPGESITS